MLPHLNNKNRSCEWDLVDHYVKRVLVGANNTYRTHRHAFAWVKIQKYSIHTVDKFSVFPKGHLFLPSCSGFGEHYKLFIQPGLAEGTFTNYIHIISHKGTQVLSISGFLLLKSLSHNNKVDLPHVCSLLTFDF